jgi:DNA helicase-2/ATP-dependent DNA helicase PcrA
MKSDFTGLLNDHQIQAVTSIQGPLLIIAGAGSGKTRVITHRMAYMLQEGIPQSSILALTFTNKAAREMEDRVKSLTRRKLTNLTVSTFHAFGVRVLRHSIHRLGFRENFSIYDQGDQISLIKETARELRLAPESLELSKIVSLFSAVKTGRKTWDGMNDGFRPLYEEYQSHLKVYNAVDFDDLITLPIHILRTFPAVLEEYRARYKYIMVDEFQDTSMNQYEFMKFLADGSRNICVVGDDDQSIYSWRGANYENLLRFERDFPELVEIKLEQNYRSTGTILAAANGVISHNKNRKVKELWTGSAGGRPIEVFFPEDERKEGEFIASMIKSLAFKERIKYHDMGILVRTNSLSRTLEEALLGENIPYRVSGGESFFQRKEIKDIIAYLRIMANPDDDVSILRVINTPRRGLGRKTIEQITETAKNRSCSFYSAMTVLVHAADSPLGEKTKTEISAFLALIEEHRSLALKPKRIAEAVRSLVNTVDYWGYLVVEFQKNDKVAKWKYKNIEVFANSIEEWEKDSENFNPGLYNYLNRISLITRDDIEEDDDTGKINLMTIHSAKGLEYDVVFLAGVENGIIPHARSLGESEENIEEERRLFYVAITRARLKLYITACRMRKVMRENLEASPSPFLEEIPKDLIVYHEDEGPVPEEEAKDFFASLKQKLSAGA